MRCVIVALVALVIVPDARADRQKAEQLYRSAARAYKNQKYVDACEQFDAAYKELDAPEIAFSAGQAYRRAYGVTRNPDQARAAIDYYKKYLAKVSSGGRSGDAQHSIDELERDLAHSGDKVVRPPVDENEARLGVSVTFADQQVASGLREIDDRSSAPDVPVRVWIDGELREPDKFYTVKPGDHVVRGEADGYRAIDKKVRLIKGDARNEELPLEPLPARIVIKTERGARIVVDGRTAPSTSLELPAGKHLIAVLRKGRAPAAVEVDARRAEQQDVRVPLVKSWRRRAVPYAIGGSLVGAGVAAFGAVGMWQFGRVARDKRDLLLAGDQDPQVLADYHTWRDRRGQAETAVWVGAGAAVGFGLIAAGLYYFDTPSAEGVRVTPMVTPGAAAAVVSGTF